MCQHHVTEKVYSVKNEGGKENYNNPQLYSGHLFFVKWLGVVAAFNTLLLKAGRVFRDSSLN